MCELDHSWRIQMKLHYFMTTNTNTFYDSIEFYDHTLLRWKLITVNLKFFNKNIICILEFCKYQYFILLCNL